MEYPDRLFGSVQRQRSSPLCVQKQLVLRAVFQPLLDDEYRNTEGNSAVESLADLDESELAEDSQENPDLHVEDDIVPANKYTESNIMIRHAIEFLEEQEDLGNTRFLDKLISDSTKIGSLVDQIQQLESKRTMPLNWTQSRGSATISYQEIS